MRELHNGGLHQSSRKTWDQAMCGRVTFPARRPLRNHFIKLWRWSLSCKGKPILEMPGLWEEWNGPKSVCVCCSPQRGEWCCLWPWEPQWRHQGLHIQDMELKNMVFSLVDFLQALPGFSLLCPPFLFFFGVGMFILCHCILEVYNSYFLFYRDSVKRLCESWKKLCTYTFE